MSLTVEGVAYQDGRRALQGLKLNLINDGHVVEALAIDEEFEATGHRNFRHAGLRCFVSVTNAHKRQVCTKKLERKQSCQIIIFARLTIVLCPCDAHEERQQDQS